jgi:hypothetical protein
MKASKISKSSVLKKQKPKYKFLKRALKWSKHLRYIGIGTAVLLAGFGIYQILPSFDWQSVEASWTIELHPESSPLSDAERSAVTQFVTQRVNQREPLERGSLASRLQSKFSLKESTVIETAAHHLIVKVVKRMPIAVVEADVLRFVDESGSIFERADKTVQLPLLKGLFPSNFKAQWNSDNTLRISGNQLAVLKDVLILITDAKKYKVNISEIQYVEYRGFQISLDDHIRVMMGRYPFDTKFQRLLQVINSRTRKPDEALVIELDFEDKAFIGNRKF